MSFRLLCDAIPFCYGPAAALETFLDAFFVTQGSPAEVDVLASGSTLELLRRSKHPLRLLDVDSEDPEALSSVQFRAYDAFLNVCNPVSFRAAQAQGTPTAYLDFLLWMHSGPRAAHFDADLYLAENYPGTEEWVGRRGKEIANLVVVPPLIRVRPKSGSAGTLVIGLGGLYSRLTIPGENTNYAPFVLENVLAAIPRDRFSHVVVAGPARLREAVAGIVATVPNAEYVSLSHHEFVDVLATAELFVSHPGLYAAFEAMLSGVPTAFLPPSNYTQVLQLRHYRSLGLADHSFSWEDAALGIVADGMPEEDGVRAILSVVAQAEASPAAAAGIRRFLADFFNRSAATLAEVGERQRVLASNFGIDGPRFTAERFAEWTAGLPQRGAR